MYLNAFRELAQLDWDNDTDNYITGQAAELLRNNSNPTSFELGASYRGYNVYVLFNRLMSAHATVQAMSQAVANSETAEENYQRAHATAEAAQSKYDEKKRIYDGKVREKENETSKYNVCISAYQPFTNAYQTDLYYYDLYVNTAKNVINDRCAAVANQYNAIKNNIDAIVNELDSIYSRLDTAKNAIEEYYESIQIWENQNNSYIASGADSFSDQNKEDINASRTEYNLDSLATLMSAVDLIRAEYKSFQSRMNDQVHYKYGGSKVGSITNWEQALNAFKTSGTTGSASQIITRDVANDVFSSLYNSDTTKELEPMMGQEEQWHFFKPITLPN